MRNSHVWYLVGLQISFCSMFVIVLFWGFLFLGVTQTFQIVCDLARQGVTNLKTKEEFYLGIARTGPVIHKLLCVIHQIYSIQYGFCLSGYCVLEVNKIITTIMQ